MEEEYVMFSGLYSLNLVGLHPFKSSFKKGVVALIFIVFTLICYALNLAGVILKYDGLKSLADSIDAVPAGQQVMVKLLSVLFLRNEMKHLYNTVEKKWDNKIYGEELENTIKKLSLKFKKIYNTYRMTIWVTAILYVSKPLILFSRTLLTEMYIPCNLSQNYCYISFIAIQTIYIFDLAFVVYTFDGIFYAFLFYVYCELEKIKYGFANLNVSITTDLNNNEEDCYTKFCEIVKHHYSMIKFLQDVNKVYYLQLLNHFVTITATIVFGIFFMNMDGFPPALGKVSRYIPYLMSYHFQLYIYCMWGQQVFDQVCSVCDVIYQSQWYVRYQPKLAKGMLLVMKVSQIQNKLTIGDMWKLNLGTFMSVIKTSMSFHAFMQTVYKSDEVLVESYNQTIF
uniref:Odorant receptor n=1 Tax=Anomala corpulenta TaxID=931571 RepID=A0A0E3Y607_9SCAR|nr:odorant receptor 8 [Anomala corpulenta]